MPVNPRRNVERIAPVTAKSVRFTILATNNLEPCLDELEVFGPEPARNLALLQIGRVRIIIATAFVEAFFFFGGFVYLGAYLRHQFALSYLAVGGRC